MQDLIFSAVMPLLPKKDLGHWVGRMAHKSLPDPLRLASMRAFARTFNINLEEAELPLEQYRSVGDLFTRKLKPGLRPVAEGLVHPCDSRIAAAGRICDGQAIQAKGIEYSVAALLGESKSAFLGDGAYITYYLCPTDYHRVHLPLDAHCESVRHIPGAFWPVNDWSVRNVKQLYAVNERVAMVFCTEHGERFALVMVAATNVGNIKISIQPSISDTIVLNKGDEVGLFAMGSTVVFLADANLSARYHLDRDLLASLMGTAVRVNSSFSVRKST